MSGIFNTVQHNKCQKVKKIKGKSVICKASADFKWIPKDCFGCFFECFLNVTCEVH